MAAAMIEIRRMWPGGPLREFATERPNSSWGTPYQSNTLAGFAGRYVCESCLKPSPMGVYQVTAAQNRGSSWLCAACREKVRPRKPQPEGLARAQRTREEALAT